MSVICEHKTTYVEHDIGWDIYEGGEERQHMEVCRGCGASRIISECTSSIGHPVTYWGNWLLPEEDYND